MKRITIILALIIACISFTYGQTDYGPITRKKGAFGYVFYQDGKKLRQGELVNAVKFNEKASKQIKSARETNIFGAIIGFAGGFIVGWQLPKEPRNWTYIGLGAGLIIVSIPINQQYIKETKQAIDTYNDGLQTSSIRKKGELRFSMIGRGIGLAFRF